MTECQRYKRRKISNN